MQTFLPYPDFEKSAKVLDYRRLGKQRVETYQILLILSDKTEKKGWRNHPAVKMWKGHEISLCEYGQAICHEWRKRGYKDTMMPKISEILDYFLSIKPNSKGEVGLNIDGYWDDTPEWIGNNDFHRAHQSNLIRKDKEFYAPKFPGVPNNLPYIWPV